VPCDDRAAGLLVSEWHRAREGGDIGRVQLIERSLGNPGAYDTLMSRKRFIAAAVAEGLRAPPMRSLRSESEMEQALTDVGLPAVMKSDGTWGGEGVRMVADRDQASSAFHALSTAPGPLRSLYRAGARRDAHHLLGLFASRSAQKPASLQRFIEGTPATTTFACWQGRILAAFYFDVVVSLGRTGPACVLRRVEDTDMDEAARRIAAQFGLSGLHGLDFVRDINGIPWLIECNPRATPTSHLALGTDLVAALAARLGTAVAPRPAATSRDLVALFPQEWARNADSRHLQGAHNDVPWDDPALVRALVAETRRSESPALANWLPGFLAGPTPAAKNEA
jgi:ATP-grasp domain-containing protein